MRTVTVPALSAVAGLVHGFEQRTPESPAETREQSRARVSAALAGLGRALFLKQVHGATVVEAPWAVPPEADAAVCAASGCLLSIETADCLPLLLVDPRRQLVAAAHAGWRGTAAQVASRAVAALVARGSRPDEMLVALGPAIGACCYAVGPELPEAFGSEAVAVFRVAEGGGLRLDLRATNERQLLGAGVPQRAITHVAHCTFCQAADYHSYRRDGKGAGRMISYVGFA